MLNLVTLIIPVYKAEKFLDRCVSSVVNQTYKNLDIILVDDGSPDNSPAMCDEWAKKDKRIRVIHKSNSGVSDARNTGINNAKGEFVCFVDSDDFVENNYVELMLNKQKESDADLVFCKIKKIDENGNICELYKNENMNGFLNNPTLDNFFNSNITMSASRILVKTNLAKKTLFDTELKSGEDLNFLLRLIVSNAKFDSVDEYLYIYYKNSESVTQTKSLETIKVQYFGAKKNSDLLKNNGFENIALCYEFEVCIHLAVCSLFVENAKEYVNMFNSKMHYKTYLKQKRPLGLKKRLLAFLVYHNMFRCMKILFKLKHKV